MRDNSMVTENFIALIGKVESITKIHERLGASYYEIELVVNRTTEGKCDHIVVYAPHWALPKEFALDKTVRVIGEVRTYKNRISSWQAKRTMVYTKKIIMASDNSPHINQVEIIGELHQVWNPRETPLSGKMITDFSVLVLRNDGYGKGERADLVHCLAWGEQAAVFNEIIENGGRIRILGRLQERKFEKQHPNGKVTKETIHEISCRAIEKY